MHCEREIAPGLYWIGGDDKRLGLFEAVHPVPAGMSYNSYLLIDEKTVLIDTVDRAVEERFFSTLAHVLGGRPLDVIVVNHAEPDHSATLAAVAGAHPEARIVCSKRCKAFLSQFTAGRFDERIDVVEDGDSLECGSRTLAFAEAPMVHWPEVMVTYDIEDKVLFSADAFGTFGALDGKLFDDEFDFEREWLPEARRYYANIVGKYGTQVNELLDKMETLDVELVAPLHGPLLRANIDKAVAAHRAWASYEPEDQGVVIAYASVYGGTRDVAEKLAFALSDLGVHDLALFDLSVTDPSYVLAEAFRASNIVLASVTYNAGMFPKMAELVECLTSHNLRRRRFSFIQNGTWGPIAGKRMLAAIEGIPEAQVVGEMLTVKSRMRTEQDEELEALARAIADSIEHPEPELLAEVQQVADAPRPIAGAVREQPAAPKVERVAGTDIPIAPGMEGSVVARPVAQAQPAAEPQEPRIVQIWRCSYCGFQIEVPKGRGMSAIQCPVCLKKDPGLFRLVREKVVS